MGFRGAHPYSSTFKKDSTNTGVDFDSQHHEKNLNDLWREMLAAGMHGICYSAYSEGQSPGHILTREQIQRRMAVIAPYTKWVRTFSCIEGNELIPQVAKEFGLKTMVGAWIGDDNELIQKEMKGLEALAKDGFVDIAAVGNEVLYRNDQPKYELLQYMHWAKSFLPDSIPMGYVDAYYEFPTHPDVSSLCDVILTNCYPFWEGTAIDDALNHMKHMYAVAKSAANGKPVIITETGWPSTGQQFKGALPSAENFIRYFIETQNWAKAEDIPVFYFSSFDEGWKTGPEGDVGAHWGIWDKHEQLKF